MVETCLSVHVWFMLMTCIFVIKDFTCGNPPTGFLRYRFHSSGNYLGTRRNASDWSWKRVIACCSMFLWMWFLILSHMVRVQVGTNRFCSILKRSMTFTWTTYFTYNLAHIAKCNILRIGIKSILIVYNISN